MLHGRFQPHQGGRRSAVPAGPALSGWTPWHHARSRPILGRQRATECGARRAKGGFTPNANDRTQILYNDKQAEYSHRPLNHQRSAPLIMTVKLMIKAKDILNAVNRERQQDREFERQV